MRNFEIITHQGKQVLYINLEGLKQKEEIIRLEGEAAKYIQSQPPNSILVITNMEGMHFNNEIKQFFEETVKANAPFVKGSAVIGLSGLISIFYNGFVKLTSRDVRSFKTKQDALNYLIKK